jgi:hypothetical protein
MVRAEVGANRPATMAVSCVRFRPNLWSAHGAAGYSRALYRLESVDTAPTRTNRKHSSFLEAVLVFLRTWKCARSRHPELQQLMQSVTPGRTFGSSMRYRCEDASPS